MVDFSSWICLEKSKVLKKDDLRALHGEKGLRRETWEQEGFLRNDRDSPNFFQSVGLEEAEGSRACKSGKSPGGKGGQPLTQ